MYAAVLCAAAGTALLVGRLGGVTAHARPLDWVVGLGSAVSFAFYITYSKRGLARYPVLAVQFVTFLVAAGLWAVVTPPWRILSAGYPADVWGLFLLIGVASTLVPFTLFNRGLERLRPSEAAVLATIEPVVAIFLAVVFLGEGLVGRQWLGAILVVGATLLAAAKAPEEVAISVERL